MDKKDIILFDLDGTLTDPGEGITNSVAYALSKYGMEVSDRKALYSFIGPPLVDSFMKFYGFSEEGAKEAVSVYREYFRDRGIFENLLYPGVKEMLAGLRAAGATLVLATSKPEVFALRILEHFGIAEFFTAVAGSSLDHSRTDKHEVIEYALWKLTASGDEPFVGEKGSSGSGGADLCVGEEIRTRAVMVGDREHDVSGAKKSRLSSVGVLYGYGSREELLTAEADEIVPDVPSLSALLRSLLSGAENR